MFQSFARWCFGRVVTFLNARCCYYRIVDIVDKWEKTKKKKCCFPLWNRLVKNNKIAVKWFKNQFFVLGNRLPVVAIKSFGISAIKMSSLAQYQNYETLLVTSPKENVVHVQLNRPIQMNAMNQAFWRWYQFFSFCFFILCLLVCIFCFLPQGNGWMFPHHQRWQ